MDKALKDAIRRSRVFLKENISDINGVVDNLYCQGVLTSSMKDDILAESRASFQITALLDIIPKRGKAAYQEFINVLKQTENFDSAKRLEEAAAGVELTHTATSSYSVTPKYEKLIVHTEHHKATEVYSGQKEEIKKEMKEEKETEKENPSTNPNVKHWIEQQEGIFVDRKEMKFSDEKFYDQIKKENVFYDMRKTKKGHVIILVNFNESKCLGLSKDREKSCLSNIFHEMGFKDSSQKFLKLKTAKELEEVLRSSLDGMDFENYPSCFIVALSIGPDASKIYGSSREDSTTAQKLADIMKNCSKLQDKPKVVIYQTIPDTWSQDPEETVDQCPLHEGDDNTDDVFIVTAESCHNCDPAIRYRIDSKKNARGTYFLRALKHAFQFFSQDHSFVDTMKEVHNLLVDGRYHCDVEREDPENEKGNTDVDKCDSQPEMKIQVAKVKLETICKRKQFYLLPGLKESSGHQVSG